MKSIGRNAPCPCGSGKKYKLCCFSTQSEPDSPGAKDVTDSTMRSNAFARLVEFGSKPRFRAALQTGLDEFWSPAFTQRSRHEQELAYARPEADIGMASYLMLDAPALFGTTIVEQFLAERTSHVARAEREYLQQLALTRMSLYRIDDVRLDEGLTCVELWKNERVEIREKRLTHDVAAGSVVAARAFSTPQGTTVFDGAVYLFSLADALKLVSSLQAQWRSARKVNPAISEQQFLKRHFPTAINRFWFDHIFAYDDQLAHDDHRSLASSNVSEASAELLTPRDRRRRDFAQADPLSARLADFLYSEAAPTAMSIDRLHGFLCAVTCNPVPLGPSAWLPIVWGDRDPSFDSNTAAERAVGDIFEFANRIADTLADQTFEPLLPLRLEAGMRSVAQQWCSGFAEGTALDTGSWEKLLDNEAVSVYMVPILTLAAPADNGLIDESDARSLEELVELLPIVVRAIAVESRSAPQKRKQRAAKAARTRSGARGADATPATTSVHRLKITLDGVRPPVWRRIEIASDAKLPFVSRVLIASMGWTNTHLHEFRTGTESYGVPDPHYPSDMRNERSVTLADIASHVKDRFFFDYDFGDGWVHTVVVESIETVAEANVPGCIVGARACPPEDCGGLPGYANLLRILDDPADEEHAAMREWAGSDFDPARFDLEEVNRDLRRLVRKRRAH